MVVDNLHDAKLSGGRLKLGVAPAWLPAAAGSRRSLRIAMCTVSFVPHSCGGFCLAMNRDELRSRPVGLPPRSFGRQGVAALYPSEPTGGTWVGVNEHGLCLALVNWYAIQRTVGEERVSRGILIPRLLTWRTFDEVRCDIARMPLGHTQPFRLFLVALREKRLGEFRWDGEQTGELFHAWEPRHWFSSGHDEARANVVRAEVCRGAWLETDAGTLPWLRRLHASHEPERGPFSICMHRPEAVTVSYTEVEVTRTEVTMRYVAGPVCRCKETSEDPTHLPEPHEHTTLRIRPVGGALLSSGLPSRSADYLHAARGDAVDKSDL